MLDVLKVNVFGDNSLLSKMNSYRRQMETRKFSLDGENKQLIMNLKGTGEEFSVYKEKLLELIDTPRNYEQIMLHDSVVVDNLYELELLGVGKYTKEYVCIIDFGDCLDLVLSILCGADMNNVRSIPEYSRYSRAILMGNTEDIVDLRFGEIVACDPAIEEYLYSIESAVLTEEEIEFSTETTIAKVLSPFYRDLIVKLHEIRDYVFYAIKEEYEEYSSIIYRSKNHSCALFTSDVPIDKNILLTYKHISKCITIKNYKKMEYALEKGATNE